MEPKKLLTIEQLEESLQVSRTTIYELRKEGMPNIKIGKSVRFDFDQVVEWLQERQEHQ